MESTLNKMQSDFFDEQLPCSKVKSVIVSTYFRQWAKIITKYAKKIGYIDFFCGPGKYEDGSDSTPILILKSAIVDPVLKESLVTIFNDIDSTNVEKLKNEISKIPSIKSLKYDPFVDNSKVGDEIVNKMKSINLIPSLIFIDPWGYKGLSLSLIASVIKDWGCDCIFFFNYNRINAAITNPFMEENVNSIFGKDVADELREKVKPLSPYKREELILSVVMDALKSIKGQYSIKYKFFQEDGSKTSHFLILVTKNPLGYHLMKEIMASNCNDIDGVPTFEFNPSKDNIPKPIDLFTGMVGPMIDLCDSLIQEYNDQTLTVEEIYQKHNVGKPYIKSNYKTALIRLESENKIICDPPKEKRRKHNNKITMGDPVKITFKIK